MDAQTIRKVLQLARPLIDAGVDFDYIELALPQHAERLADTDPGKLAEEVLAAVPDKWKTTKADADAYDPVAAGHELAKQQRADPNIAFT